MASFNQSALIQYYQALHTAEMTMCHRIQNRNLSKQKRRDILVEGGAYTSHSIGTRAFAITGATLLQKGNISHYIMPTTQAKYKQNRRFDLQIQKFPRHKGCAKHISKAKLKQKLHKARSFQEQQLRTTNNEDKLSRA